MSTLRTNHVQIGQSGTATQNFVISVPATPDGTLKIARGNVGATTQDILTVAADGTVDINTLRVGGNAPASTPGFILMAQGII